MIIGTGVDIVEISRIRKAAVKWKGKFLNRIFTDIELNYARRRKFLYQHLAARFAAKEAVIKAFGEPRKFPIKWTDIEVLNDKEGKPVIEFRGDALKLKKLKKIKDVILSLSHSKNYAVANVILLKK